MATARHVIAARMFAVAAEYQLKLLRLLRLGPTTIPASSTGYHPALAMAVLCDEKICLHYLYGRFVAGEKCLPDGNTVIVNF
jgi:hypothetical protein